MQDKQPPRNLSRHQYGTLKFIKNNHVTFNYLRHAHATTLASVARWGWIVAKGTKDNDPVILTKAGEEEVRLYEQATLNERSHEADLTERCLRLLRHSRKIVTMHRRMAA